MAKDKNRTLQQPNPSEIETKAEAATAAAEHEGNSAAVAGRIGPGPGPSGVTGTSLRDHFESLKESASEAEDKIRGTARLVASGDVLSADDQRDLAVFLRTAGWTPDKFDLEVMTQRERLAIRDEMRDGPAAAKELAEIENAVAAIQQERAKLVADIDARLAAANQKALGAAARVRKSEAAAKRLRAGAPEHIRRKLKDAQANVVRIGQVFELAEQKANADAAEVVAAKSAVEASAAGTTARKAAEEALDAANKKAELSLRELELRREALADAHAEVQEQVRLCEIS